MPKKPKYSSKFQKEWEASYPFLRPVADNVHSAWCSWCKCNFDVSHGGKNDVKRHCESQKHQASKAAVEKSSTLSSFFSVGDQMTDKVSLTCTRDAKFVI